MRKKYPQPEAEPIKVPKFCEENGFYATEKSSKMMSKIKGSNNKTELLVRKILSEFGLRYRLHPKNLPGKPDLAFKKHKTVVFIDGDFWHGKNWESEKEKIKSNRDFWLKKIERNMQRDRAVTLLLRRMGYNVLRFWEDEVRKNPGIIAFAILRIVEKNLDFEEN